MENLFDVLILLQDHSYCSVQRAKPRASRERRDQQEVLSGDRKRQRLADLAGVPKKRKRTSEAPSAVDVPGVLTLVPKPGATIPPAELPAVLNVAPSLQPPTARLLDVSPLTIYNRSVAEYQQIYHEVVDGMLRYKSGRHRPYSLELGRRIKQKLWERLDRPAFASSASEGHLIHVEASYGVGVYPPLYDVDTAGEPQPQKY